MAALIEGRTGPWEMVIGLEIHAQVSSEAKLFSGASTAFGAEPNTQVSLVDAAMPGMLPVINAHCIEQAVRTGLALGAAINLVSVFDRKNYFYPDLPPGYQISQFSQPIVGKGHVTVDLEGGATTEVGITRLHLEQDAGKSIHDRDPRATHVDLNRAGVALMEIVSEPDIRSPEEAGAYLRKVRSILRYIGSCDGNMEQGSMRCDVNLSMRRPGEPMGTRTETKNVNSVRFVIRALEYEAARQVELLEDGGTVDQETLLFDPDRGETRAMRSKEEAHDYRYFPDPDLLPLTLDEAWVDAIAAGLPELPDAKKARFVNNYMLTPNVAGVLVADRDVADAFEEKIEKISTNKYGIERTKEIREILHDINKDIDKIPEREYLAYSSTATANTIVSVIFSIASVRDETVPELIRRLDLEGLRQLLDDDVISGRGAKDVLLSMVDTGMKAAAIVKDKGLRQITDAGAIEAIVDQIIADNPGQAGQFAENPKVIGWFVGQVMKATQGQANPGVVNAVLRKKLGA